MAETNEQRLAKAIPIAENLMAEKFGGSIKLDAPEMLGDRPYVHRMTLKEGPTDAPSTVVVKQAPIWKDEPYEPDSAHGPAMRLFNDWASLQLLTEVADEDSSAARFFGGNRDAGVIVIEDLGSDQRLDHFLLADNAEVAEENLIRLFKTVGRMHAQTIGKKARYDAIREALGPTQESSESTAERTKQLLEKIRSGLQAIEVKPQSNFFAEIEAAAAEFSEPGPFHALIHQDPCPDNCLLGNTGMRLLDFEHGRFGHALRDGVYPRIHFPTCWCVNRLPDPVWRRAEITYREELVKGCPEAADDEMFYRAATIAAAYWALMVFFEWAVPHVFEEDKQWGISMQRQRPIMRFELLARTTDELGHLPAIGGTSRDISAKLRQLWPDTEEMPYYPAFR